MTNDKDKKYVPLRAGWVKGLEEKFQENFQKIVVFYLLETPCEEISYQSKPLKKYGWKKDVWSNKKGGLKEKMMNVSDLEFNSNLFRVNRLNDMSRILSKAKMNDSFQKNRETEKIVVYLSSRYKSTFMSVFFHIRNSIAHGRFSIYEKEGMVVYVFESGVKYEDKLSVRARIILKETTLLDWIDIIKQGPN